MPDGTDVVPAASADLDVLSPEEQRLADLARADVADRRTVLPVLKVTQALTKEVAEGDISAGVFLNSLTGTDYGSKVELLIVRSFLGRFYAPLKDDAVYIATGDIAPDNWPEEYRGQRFVDLADAEERYKERANAGEIEWEKGPPIRTTYNYVGLVVSELEIPVRISFQRTSTGAARKLDTLLRTARAFWDNIYTFQTNLTHNASKQAYYEVSVERGRRSEAAERQAAVSLALAIEQHGYQFAGDEKDPDDKPTAPATPEDALAID